MQENLDIKNHTNKDSLNTSIPVFEFNWGLWWDIKRASLRRRLASAWSWPMTQTSKVLLLLLFVLMFVSVHWFWPICLNTDEFLSVVCSTKRGGRHGKCCRYRISYSVCRLACRQNFEGSKCCHPWWHSAINNILSLLRSCLGNSSDCGLCALAWCQGLHDGKCAW